MRRRARAWLVAAAIAVLGCWAAPVAQAEEPLELDARITDAVGAVAGREEQVEAAINRLLSEHGLRLYVVYVDHFSGWDPQEWADETATRSQLTARDAVLAVATEERGYALSVDPEFPLTGFQANEIKTIAIEPALRASDWAAAAVAAAEALRDVREGNDVRPPDIEQATPAAPAEGSGGGPWVFVAVGVVVPLLAAAVWWILRRRSGEERARPDGGPVQGRL